MLHVRPTSANTNILRIKNVGQVSTRKRGSGAVTVGGIALHNLGVSSELASITPDSHCLVRRSNTGSAQTELWRHQNKILPSSRYWGRYWNCHILLGLEHRETQLRSFIACALHQIGWLIKDGMGAARSMQKSWKIHTQLQSENMKGRDHLEDLEVSGKAIRRYIQKFPDWPPGARTANGIALCHWVQLYHYFVSQSSEFCHHNHLCCFSTIIPKVSVYSVIDSVRKLLDTPSYWNGS